MAAQNRRRNDTSRHAVGVWEEFSFLDKGNIKRRIHRGQTLWVFFWGTELGFGPGLCVPFRERQSNHLEKFLKYPKNGNTFYFRPNHLRRPGKSRNDEAHATCSYQQPHQVPKVRSLELMVKSL
jgi:hypothetical protein